MFRLELGINSSVMDDTAVNAVFDQAEGDYAGYSRIVVRYAAYVTAISALVNAAANLADYEANEAREKLSQIPANLEKRLSSYQKKLDEATANETTVGVRFGRPKQIPPRVRDVPDC
jgi:5,10-methenyltetrahydromethanopterin hydrogenase